MYMKVHLPDEISEYEPELRFFMELMVRKLHTNRHKGFAGKVTFTGLMDGLEREVTELQMAIDTSHQMDVATEAVDVANMAFLTATAALRMERPEFDARKPAAPRRTGGLVGQPYPQPRHGEGDGSGAGIAPGTTAPAPLPARPGGPVERDPWDPATAEEFVRRGSGRGEY